MELKEFVRSVSALASKEGISPKIKHDKERGMYIAYLCGIRLSGNSYSSKITVRWGNYHQAQVDIKEISINCLQAEY